MNTRLIIIWALALVCCLGRAAYGGSTDHLGGSFMLTTATCLGFNAFTGFDSPWAGTIAGVVLTNAVGVFVEADQGFQGDYREDMALNAAGSAIGGALCYKISSELKERTEERLKFGGGPMGSMGATIEIRF